MINTIHKYYIDRCIQLAKKGIGYTTPNPLVGSVVVFENRIIGEGYHKLYGQNHAEVNAINSVKNKSLLNKSTIYVNLEPCAHFGKTPPCANLISSYKIPRVVVGCTDSFEKVAGKGIAHLKENGTEVITGVLENECRELNKRFFTFHEKKRPYIILKWAQTIDGYIDKIREKDAPVGPNWISGMPERILVHKWRTEEDAVIAGTNTFEKDNPKLNVRDFSGKNPLRIVLDRNGRLNKSLNVFDQTAPTLSFIDLKPKTPKLPVTSDIPVDFVRIDFQYDALQQILNVLYSRNITSLIVEGGTKLFNSFIQQNLWDEARIFTGKKRFSGGISAPVLDGKIIEEQIFNESILQIIRNN